MHKSKKSKWSSHNAETAKNERDKWSKVKRNERHDICVSVKCHDNHQDDVKLITSWYLIDYKQFAIEIVVGSSVIQQKCWELGIRTDV